MVAAYIQDDDELVAEILADPEVAEILDGWANEALVVSQSVAQGISRTGAYAASLRVEDGALVSDDPEANIIEDGSANNPPYAPLRTGAESVGATVVEMTDDEPEPL